MNIDISIYIYIHISFAPELSRTLGKAFARAVCFQGADLKHFLEERERVHGAQYL